MADDNPGGQQPEKKPTNGRRNPIAFLVNMWNEGGPERTRLVVWVILGGFGIYLIGTGIVGIFTKAQ